MTTTSHIPKLMSPQDLYADPKRFLNIPHELHDTVRDFMSTLYPDFDKKLRDVHCFRCEGMSEFLVQFNESGEYQLVTGYIGDLSDAQNVQLSVENIDRERLRAELLNDLRRFDDGIQGVAAVQVPEKKLTVGKMDKPNP